jgi:hypothetical protein
VKKLTLTDWAQLAEIIAAVAVVISLIYVGAGLRANAAAIRSASVQAITNTFVALLTAQTTSADLSRIRRIGDMDQSSLNEDEQYRYRTLYHQLWISFQNVYLQMRLDVVGGDLRETYRRIICAELQKPGVRATWKDHASVLNPDFVEAAEAYPSF